MTNPSQKVLIDTSAWVAFLSQNTGKLGDEVACAIEQDRAYVCGIVIAELLQATLDKKSQQQLNFLFKQIKSLPMNDGMMLKAGIKLQQLRSKGVHLSLNEALIAEIATEHKVQLLSEEMV